MPDAADRTPDPKLMGRTFSGLESRDCKGGETTSGLHTVQGDPGDRPSRNLEFAANTARHRASVIDVVEYRHHSSAVGALENASEVFVSFPKAFR